MLYFAIPKGDPHLLKLRGERARLEAGESTRSVYPSVQRPDITAACAMVYLKHVDMGETEVAVSQVSAEALAYLRANGGKFGR